MEKGFLRRSVVLIMVTLMVLLIACNKDTGGMPGTSGTPESTEPTPESSAPAASADSNVSREGLPIVKDTITLEGMVSKDVKVPDWNEHPATAELEKRTNIQIEWDCVPSEGFAEKRNLRFASNDLPDFLIRAGLTPDLEMKYASAKQIIALDEYFDYAPNLTRLMSEDKSIYQNIVLPDGHVYSLPQLNETEANLINKYWLNMKWLKNLNLEVPETTEDFYNVLKAFVEKDPNGNGKADEIGYSGSFKENPLEIIRNFLGSWGFGKNAGIINGLMDVDDSGKIRLITIEPKYKEVIEFMNRMWKDGLIDKEIFSQQSAQVISKITADQVGFTNFGNNTLWMGVNSDNYDQPPVLKGPYGDSIWSNVNPKVQTTGTFVITGKNQYPEETMRWADYFYSKEGTILVRLGIEGKSFSIDKDGKYQLLDEIKNDPTGLGQDQAQAKWTLYCGGGIPQYAIDELDQSPAQLPAMKKTTETLRPDLIPLSSIPRLKFTEEESIRLGTYSQDIKTYITQNIVKFITGEQSMSKWDKYVSDLQKMDIEDYISIYQESYDRWKNTLN